MPLSIWSGLGTCAVVLALLGCGIQSQKRAQHIESQLKYAISENETCQAWLRKSDVYKRLDKILVLREDDSDVSRKIRIDRNAEVSEKEDLLRLNNLAAVCRKNNLENFGRVHPEFAALLAGWYAESDEALLELLKEEVTIGEANELANKRMAERKTQSDAAGSRITQQLETFHQTQAADRQRAVAAMQHWNDQQQLLLQNHQVSDALTRPTITNCSYRDNSISCTNY